MNKVLMMGRLTKDPEITYAKSDQNKAIARYTIAINRVVKKDTEPAADFIPCVAFGKSAEFAQKYLKKGTKLVVEGRLYQSIWVDSETKKNRSAINIIVEKQEFAESKKEDTQGTVDTKAQDITDDVQQFINIPDEIDDLPFE